MCLPYQIDVTSFENEHKLELLAMREMFVRAKITYSTVITICVKSLDILLLLAEHFSYVFSNYNG